MKNNSLRLGPPVSTTSWRADIDGLRALAIVAVVGYHFFPGMVRGGFVGVDIFFVISGYLITRILLNAQEAGTFSVAGFYAARVRRIFPALVLVLAAVLAASWAWLYQVEQARVGQQVVAGAVFVANVLLWQDSGYFDAPIDTKPLAHLWSLGVEEQFYLAWPLLVAFLARRGRMRSGLVVLAVASAAANVLLVNSHAEAVFYLPVFRFWELLGGAMLACAQREGRPAWSGRAADWASGAGVALLAFGLLLIHGGRKFPGWWAGLPVAGTMLLIAAGPGAAFNRRWLSHRAMVLLGWISYPLYLWHWPLLAFARTVFGAEPNAWGMGILLVLSVLLAVLTWRLVETPLRSPGAGRLKLGGLLAAMFLVGATGIAVYEAPGGPMPPDMLRWPKLPPPPEEMMENNADIVADCRLADPKALHLVRFCRRDGRGPERFAVIGDSKAGVLFNGLVRTSSPAGRWLLIGGAQQRSSVLPVLTDDPNWQASQPAVRLALESIRRNPRIETVLIAASTRKLYLLARDDSLDDLPSSSNHDAALEGVRNFTRELLQAGKKVVLLVDNPTLTAPRICLLPTSRFPALDPIAERLTRPNHRCEIRIEQHRALSANYRRLLEQVRELAPDRVTIFDTLPYLCGASGVCGIDDGEHILYSYSDHISDYAAGKIGAVLNARLTARPGAAAP